MGADVMGPDAAPLSSRVHLISPVELLEVLGSPDLRVIDASFELTNPLAGAESYRAGHVPGAVHLDLDEDLSSPPGGASGGRHPLPDMREFADRLGALGIGREHTVVVYDQTGTMYAARAWWLLRYAGHERVRFLDGGLAAYVAAGGVLTTDVPSRPPVTFTLDLRHELVATIDDVEAGIDDERVALLDARAPERYRGEVEPLDAKAGHIPGARNLPFTMALDAQRLASRDELVVRLGVDDLRERDVIAYCGSGVSAAQLVLALEEAGLDGVRLYPGSWSEWSSRPDHPVATGAEVDEAR